MKFNWGTGIVIAIAAFMGFILYMVITMSTTKKYNHDFVVDDYYKEELKYQDEIDKIDNLTKIGGTIAVSTQGDNIVITFPETLPFEEVKGKVIFYRPSKRSLDFSVPLHLKSNQWVFPKKNIIKGRWNLSVDFTANKKAYLYKEEIFL